MKRTLRVLQVEDSERDAALLVRHLSLSGYELICKRVQTPETMKATIEADIWDVILCDYSMPNFNALEALKVLQATGLEIPLIIISGTIGEEVAVEAMRAGAHDYLMKDNLVRLVPTLERELHEAENRRARQRAEAELKESEAELRAVFEAMTDIIFVIGADGRLLKMGPTKSASAFQPAAERIGKTLLEIFPRETADLFLEQVRRALDQGRMQRVEYSLSIAGREVLFEGSVSPMTRDSVVWIARDITERKHAEQDLRESEERYRLLFERNPQPMWVFDLETLAFLEVNSAAIHHYGYSREEFLAMTIADIRPPEDIPKLIASFSAANPLHDEAGVWRHKKKDGAIIDVEITAHELTLNGQAAQIVLAYDVTSRRTLEEQLWRSQKLEAIGMLAGGVAHDFNNLLTVITGFSELSLRRLREEDPLYANINEVKKAAERAAGLTRQLLAFSRKQVMQPKVLDLNAVVSELEKMLRRLIGEDIGLLTLLETKVGRIKADPGQIEQIIMNLAVNARDAMPQGGKLTIETKNVYLDENYAKTHIAVIPGPYIMLAVSDTGEGMDQQTQTHIFEPFFTTKEAGKGTGLGLSTVYGIVKQSSGSIWVYSEIGHGTTVKVYLPRVDESLAEHQRRAATEGSSEGGETVLVAEDEEVVRKLARLILERYGYQVLEGANGGAALLICEHHQGPIHLLLTDVIMPEMGGRELADRLSQLRPEMKVLYMSGYTANAIVHKGVLDEGANFIQKPFPTEALARKVREVLDAPQKS